MRNKTRLLFCLGLLLTLFYCWQVSANMPTKITVTKTNYQGWEDAYIFSNGQVEAVVVPKVGRIMQFRFLGGENTFWENPLVYGQVPNITLEEWGAAGAGGDKTWPAPQSEWEKISGRGWPPPDTFDSIPLTVRVSSSEVTLVSPVDRFYGMRFSRHISLELNKPVMKITTTYEKIQGKPQDVSVWTVTQFGEPVGVYAALPERSIFTQGYHQQSEDLPANFQVENGLLSLTRDRHKSHKIGSDASTLLWMGEKVSVRMDSPRLAKMSYPDNNSSTEIYTNPDPRAYVELEFLSPLKKLQIGQTISLSTKYTLIPRTTKNAEQEARKILGRQL